MWFTRRAIDAMEDPGWGPAKLHKVHTVYGSSLQPKVEAQTYTRVVEYGTDWFVFWRDGEPVEQIRASVVERIEVVEGEPICDTGACCEARR